MTAKVRTFSPPNSLAERLAQPLAALQGINGSTTPRSVPETPHAELIGGRYQQTGINSYPRMPMDTVQDGGKARGITFAAQDKLPKLPIPDLQSTCDKYLEALRPLQSAREQAETQHAVREFLKTDGPDLQDKLKKYAQGKTSYIEQFCEQYLP